RQVLGAIAGPLQPGSSCLRLGRLAHADVAAFVAERLARGLGVDTDTELPRLRALAARLADRPAFRATEPQ
ncbi:MAG: hypothetical protein IBJ17_19895, partial [Reyranella sp.]|nr:hypothetical protein [Reyranella sp.]